MKNLRLHNVSIHRNFYQNRFINKYAKKKKAKILESQSHGVPEFLVRYRRTYILNKKLKCKVWCIFFYNNGLHDSNNVLMISIFYKSSRLGLILC